MDDTKIRNCKICGQNIDLNAQICPYCGVNQSLKYSDTTNWQQTIINGEKKDAGKKNKQKKKNSPIFQIVFWIIVFFILIAMFSNN